MSSYDQKNAFVLRRVLRTEPVCGRCTERAGADHDKCLNRSLSVLGVAERFTTADVACGCPCQVPSVAGSFVPSLAENRHHEARWVEYVADREFVEEGAER
ncbi:hypothetical protein GXB85_04070 [Cellulomonas sp. APG4]|uniref:hypothetical protein n=1 Tax=Cellulomonas sp. APG4 TaxID=1538656 RepID=UPI00137A7410|nr:hypothetical protein [Cellulomonas sp. APG4]NCT90131.1 hypothetical protein [Cellulomonas sp. APG4]